MHYAFMATARTLLLASLLVSASIMGAAWWLVRNQPAPERYQLANVGGGEGIRLDKLTGTMTRCYEGVCEPLTRGDRIVATPSTNGWEAVAEVAEPVAD